MMVADVDPRLLKAVRERDQERQERIRIARVAQALIINCKTKNCGGRYASSRPTGRFGLINPGSRNVTQGEIAFREKRFVGFAEAVWFRQAAVAGSLAQRVSRTPWPEHVPLPTQAPHCLVGRWRQEFGAWPWLDPLPPLQRCLPLLLPCASHRRAHNQTLPPKP
jgi:hypothetical protein